jgi:hypothetical protein
MASVRLFENPRGLLVHLPDDVFADGLDGFLGGYDARDDDGTIHAAVGASLNCVVSYSEQIAAQIFDAGDTGNIRIRNGDRFDHRQVSVHGCLALPALGKCPFPLCQYEAFQPPAKYNICEDRGAFAYLTRAMSASCDRSTQDAGGSSSNDQWRGNPHHNRALQQSEIAA